MGGTIVKTVNTKSLIIPTGQRMPTVAFDSVTKHLMTLWPNAVIQNTEGVVYKAFWHIPFGKIDELFIYRYDDARKAWAEQGATFENNPDLLNLIVRDQDFTIVHSMSETWAADLRNNLEYIIFGFPRTQNIEKEKNMTPEFLLKLQALETRLVEKLPFTAFANPARKEQLRVTFRWDGLRIMTDKVSDLPPPSLDEIEKALAALDEDSKAVMARAGIV